MIDIVARAMASKALSQKGSSQYKNKSEFPEIGVENQLYVDTEENMIYYWDNIDSIYKSLNISVDDINIAKEAIIEVLQTEVLDGGNYTTK